MPPITCFEQAGDAPGRIMSLVNLAETYLQMNDAVQATVALDQAQALIDITPDTDPRLVGAVFGHRGWAAALVGDYDAAECLLLRGLHIVRQLDDSDSQQREMRSLLADVLERRGDQVTADQLRRQP